MGQVLTTTMCVYLVCSRPSKTHKVFDYQNSHKFWLLLRRCLCLHLFILFYYLSNQSILKTKTKMLNVQLINFTVGESKSSPPLLLPQSIHLFYPSMAFNFKRFGYACWFYRLKNISWDIIFYVLCGLWNRKLLLSLIASTIKNLKKKCPKFGWSS